MTDNIINLKDYVDKLKESAPKEESNVYEVISGLIDAFLFRAEEVKEKGMKGEWGIAVVLSFDNIPLYHDVHTQNLAVTHAQLGYVKAAVEELIMLSIADGNKIV